jgi:DNA-binding NtrC family response regulator
VDERLDSIAKQAWTDNDEYKKSLISLISIIDEEDIPILLVGESGVGKSMLAKIIHDESNREGKFIGLGCGGLSKGKIYQELIGWKSGSFTGARYDYKGKIEQANAGTLFFDEIDRAEKDVRDTIITLIDSKEYYVLGGEQRQADVSFIYGTNKDLIKLINRGEFEEDFYYRIAGRKIRIPPLRERPEDIIIIARNILYELNKKKQSNILINQQSMEYLQNQSWPGNIRQLKNYIIEAFYETLMDEGQEITIERLKNIKLDDIYISQITDFKQLENSMKICMEHWDPKNGPFLQNFIHPIAAKNYLDNCDLHLNKTNKHKKAMKFLGISGSKHKTSSLDRAFAKYDELKKNHK